MQEESSFRNTEQIAASRHLSIYGNIGTDSERWNPEPSRDVWKVLGKGEERGDFERLFPGTMPVLAAGAGYA